MKVCYGTAILQTISSDCSQTLHKCILTSEVTPKQLKLLTLNIITSVKLDI